MTTDRMLGALMGTAVGDALGMPVEGFSHTHLRMWYKGIKEYVGDEKRMDFAAGQWTGDTQATFALVRALAEPGERRQRTEREYVSLLPTARRWGATSRAAVEALAAGKRPEALPLPEIATNGAAMRVAPLGVEWAVEEWTFAQGVEQTAGVLSITHRHPVALTAGVAQAYAIRQTLCAPAGPLATAYWDDLVQRTAEIERILGEEGAVLSLKLARLAGHLSDFPLDLLDECDGAGVNADESWPFAVAMFARAPHLLEATLLSAINVGGDTETVGAMVGSLLGALHGWSAFPEAWQKGLEDASKLEEEATAFISSVQRGRA